MVLSFKYKDIPRSNDTKSLSPSIPISLSNEGPKYRFMVLLDSGADISAIPKHVAELLNLDLSGKKEKAFGIGGEGPANQSHMKIEFEKGHEKNSFRITG